MQGPPGSVVTVVSLSERRLSAKEDSAVEHVLVPNDPVGSTGFPVHNREEHTIQSCLRQNCT